jgi:hypothetical protein
MPAALTIRVLDLIIRIEFEETLSIEDIAYLTDPWASLRVDATHCADATVLVALGAPPSARAGGATKVVAGRTVEEVAESLSAAVTLLGIAHLHGRAILLHAAAIALPDGRVIGFIGPSGRGKTTASRALAQTFGYITDETLAILPDLSVIPYPKPLSILTGQPPKQSIGPERLGMLPVPSVPLRLAALALLDRRPHANASVETVELAEAILRIAPESSSLVSLPHPLGDLVDLIQATGGVRRVLYSDASSLAELVPQILAAQQPPVDGVETVAPDDLDLAPYAAADASGNPEREGPSLYRRGSWSEALWIQDRVAVHRGVHVYLLDGLGPALWRAADGRTLAALSAAVRREVPPPPDVDVDAAIASQVAAMLDAGILIKE